MPTEGQIRWTTEQAIKDYNSPYRRFAGSPTVEQVIEHYLSCQEIAAEHGIRSDAYEWWGMSKEQVVAKAASIAKAHRKNAGKRALIAKLGRDGAEDYISWKAGRRIHLK